MKAKLLAVLVSLTVLVACTHFSVTLPDGSLVKEAGAPLLTRQSEFTITHEWLDETNTLHEIRISRNTDENADAQAEMLNRLASLIERLAIAQGAGNVAR